MVKLIKLQGDSDKSETQIRNVFNDKIIIPPNSKVGLRSCRVNFLNIQDFENYTLPADTAIELDWNTGTIPPRFLQKVVVPTKDASGNVIVYESTDQLLTAIQKASNSTWSGSLDIATNRNIYQGYHTIFSLQDAKTAFFTYHFPDIPMAFASANNQFTLEAPAVATDITLANGEVGVAATTGTPLGEDVEIQGLFAIPLVNTLLSGTLAASPQNDPAAGDDCFKFLAQKDTTHNALWGWGISKNPAGNRRYAFWVNNEKYFFPDSAAIVPELGDRIKLRKCGDKARFSVSRGGTNQPIDLGNNPITTAAGSQIVTVTLPNATTGAAAGNTVFMSGVDEISRPQQDIANNGIRTANTIVNGAVNGIDVTEAKTDPIITVTTATAHNMAASDAFILNGVKGEEFDLIASAGVEVTNIQLNPVVKVTTAATHNLVAGDAFTMSGVTQTTPTPATIGGIPIADFNDVQFVVAASPVPTATTFHYVMTGSTSSDAASSGAGGRVNHNNIGDIPIADFNGFTGTVLASPVPTPTSFSYTMTGSTSTIIEAGGESSITVSTNNTNQEPLTLTFSAAHGFSVNDVFTMSGVVDFAGVAATSLNGQSHTVLSAPSTTILTIAMPAGQNATPNINGGGAAAKVDSVIPLIPAATLNSSDGFNIVTVAADKLSLTIDIGLSLHATTTGGGNTGKIAFPTQELNRIMVTGDATKPSQAGTIPLLDSASLDAQIVKWSVLSDKACGYTVNGLTYQGSGEIGNDTPAGLPINTTLTFPRSNPLGSYLGFVDTRYSDEGAPSIIKSDQPSIGRNAYPAILVQSLKGLDLDSYAGKQDSPNKPISFFDVIVPQSVDAISNMIYEPNNIAMLDLHNARPIELSDMQLQFARDDSGLPLKFFGQPTVVLELEEGSE